MPAPPTLTLLRSLLASTARGWRGTQILRTAPAPKQLLTVYDRENDARCRLLRELLTELQLDALIRPCPLGGKRYAAQLEDADELPVLLDRDHDAQCHGLDAGLRHLLSQYAGLERGAGLLGSWPMLLSSKLASALRGAAGLHARPSRKPKKPLELYSFESSPYSRLVRERLCELELPWILRSFGKEQLSDWGPPNLRLTLGLKPWQAKSGGRRAAMQARTGKAQVPYLVDPNTGTALYESMAIVAYLDARYATGAGK